MRRTDDVISIESEAFNRAPSKETRQKKRKTGNIDSAIWRSKFVAMQLKIVCFSEEKERSGKGKVYEGKLAIATSRGKRSGLEFTSSEEENHLILKP